jgi:hypothetical protein
MKKLTVALFFMGGFLMAQDQTAPPPQEQTALQVQEEPAQPAHLSENQRIALRTQSPPVKTHSWKHSDKPTKYQVTENKTTIVATRTFGQ